MASDAVLIGRSLAGDAAAFMEMVCRHEVAIGAYLEWRVGREVAEDPTAKRHGSTYGKTARG